MRGGAVPSILSETAHCSDFLFGIPDYCPVKLVTSRFLVQVMPVSPSGSRAAHQPKSVFPVNVVVETLGVRIASCCPSSDDLGHDGLMSTGGSGSFGLRFMPPSGDAANGAFRSFWL